MWKMCGVLVFTNSQPLPTGAIGFLFYAKSVYKLQGGKCPIAGYANA